jgi:enterochelin esterase family protein
VTAAAVTFRVADPEGRLSGIWLCAEVHVTRTDFQRGADEWTLVIDRPPVNRIEYLLEFRFLDGRDENVTDPGNPRLAAGAFGPKSVLEFPEYALASLTRYLAAGVAGGWLPRLRAALLGPGDRNRWYSANARYANALARLVIPATTVAIGMGTSLGALAMLHAHCQHPGTFDALFLQSGSFFCPRFDNQERRFPYYQRIIEFVAGVHVGRLVSARTIPVVLTCGVIEENIENNRLMARALQVRGYPAALHEVPDMHNYTAWRDAFDPHLTRLLQQVCQ